MVVTVLVSRSGLTVSVDQPQPGAPVPPGAFGVFADLVKAFPR